MGKLNDNIKSLNDTEDHIGLLIEHLNLASGSKQKAALEDAVATIAQIIDHKKILIKLWQTQSAIIRQKIKDGVDESVVAVKLNINLKSP